MSPLNLKQRVSKAIGHDKLVERLLNLTERTDALAEHVNRLAAQENELTAQLAALENELTARLAAQELGAATDRASLSTLATRESGLASTFVGDFYDQPRTLSMEEYWNKHNVTMHRRFSNAQESLAYLDYRNQSYPGYLERMPYDNQSGLSVLDYGCGPGNDLVGFAMYSAPKRLVGVDVSKTSLGEAEARLALHEKSAELIHIPYGTTAIPLPDESLDYIHCSGVLMLIEDPQATLAEFRRLLRPGGEIRCMVYHYDSVWVHLYVAYLLQVKSGSYSNRTLREAFSRSTDGEYCPFVHVWDQEDMNRMAAAAGLKAEFLGAPVSLWEMYLLPRRYEAAMDERLNGDSRSFLLSLTFDSKGYPLHRGQLAGIDACYRLTRA